MEFIRYSLDKKKPVKAVMIIDGAMTQKTISVKSAYENGFCYTTGKRKKESYCEYKDLLACSYARGDEEGKL